MINEHRFFDTKMTPMTSFVIFFKVQGQLCEIIPFSLVFVCLFSPLTHLIILIISLSPTPMKTRYHWRRRRHGGCHGILEKRWGMVVETSERSMVVVVSELVKERWGDGYGGGGEDNIDDGWGRRNRRSVVVVKQHGGVVVVRRFGDARIQYSMGSKIDTMGRRQPSNDEWDAGGRWTRAERDLQRQER